MSIDRIPIDDSSFVSWQRLANGLNPSILPSARRSWYVIARKTIPLWPTAAPFAQPRRDDRDEPSRATVRRLQLSAVCTEILDSPLIQAVQLAIGSDHATRVRDRFDQEAKMRSLTAKRLFSPLAIFDVRVDAVPLDDVTGLVAQRIRAKEEPSIVTVVPTQARLGFPRALRTP